MSSHRSIGLRLFIGRHGVTWALTHRSERDGRVRDGRLATGTVRYVVPRDLPSDVVGMLAAVLLALQDRFDVRYVVPALRAPGAPGGGGGRTTGRPPGYDDDPDAGHALDVALPGL